MHEKWDNDLAGECVYSDLWYTECQNWYYDFLYSFSLLCCLIVIIITIIEGNSTLTIIVHMRHIQLSYVIEITIHYHYLYAQKSSIKNMYVNQIKSKLINSTYLREKTPMNLT